MEYIRPGYIRVSEILNGLRDRSDIDPKVLEVKGKIGSEVHRNIAEEKSDGIPFFDEYPVINPYSYEIMRWEKRGLGYFLSFSEWDKAYKPEFQLMEHRLYDDDLRITGQIDALVCFKDSDVPCLIDFKCSHSADKEIWNMQAHFYCYLLRQNGVEISDTFTWIQLNKNGKRPVTHDFQFDENVLDRCIAEAVRYSELHHEGLTFD